MTDTLTVTSGDAYVGERSLIVTVTDPDGSPTDLDGVDLVFVVKRHGVTAITKTTAGGVTITAPASGGIARVALAEADTDGLSGRYVWELEADDAIGKVTLASGTFRVRPDLIA